MRQDYEKLFTPTPIPFQNKKQWKKELLPKSDNLAGFEKKLVRGFSHLKPQEPSCGLFDRIILAIKREQEIQHRKRLLFGFLTLLVISFIVTPFSWTLLVDQVKSSGILYFISTAVSDFNTFLTLWQDFSLAILESLPITGIVAFTISIGLALFTLRLFLYKKRLLLRYFMHSIPCIAFN